MIRRPEFRWQIIPMVVCFAVMVWSFMTAMVYGTAANAIWLQYLSPAWVMVAGIFILKEPYSAGDGRMFVFCMAGVLLMLTMEMTAGLSQYATVLGIISGLSFAGVVICLRTLRGVDPAWLITLNHKSHRGVVAVAQSEDASETIGFMTKIAADPNGNWSDQEKWFRSTVGEPTIQLATGTLARYKGGRFSEFNYVNAADLARYGRFRARIRFEIELPE